MELVLIQQLLPDNRSSAVGSTYFVKAAGSIAATIAIGALGDALGLQQALLTGIALGLAGVPFLLMTREPPPAASYT